MEKDADSILYGDAPPTADAEKLTIKVLDDGVVEYYQDDTRVKIFVPGGITYRLANIEWTAVGETEAWLDADGRLHRDPGAGPAMIADGTRWWYQHGRFHRQDGPAIIHADGTREYYQDGLPHRDDGPAVEYADGGRSYYLDGHLFRNETDWHNYKAWKADPLASRDGYQRNGIYWERVKS